MANMCRSNQLNIDKLCADCAKLNCAKIQQIVSDNVCSQIMWAKNLNVDNESANNLCVSGALQAKNLSADMIGGNKMCIKEGTINKLCVDNLSVGNFTPYTSYRATINFAAPITYTLGSDLNFDKIIDDPNNNVSMVPNTHYTAPVSGYYELTYKVNASNLVSSGDPILGIPVANAEVYVNGALVRESFSPFLSFLNTQKVIVSSLITLQAGDIVTMKYDVLGGNGVPVAGTVNIGGTGVEDENSLFKIIFLSGLTNNSGSGVACDQCPTVSISCAPVQVPCNPLAEPGQSNPCDSCMC